MLRYMKKQTNKLVHNDEVKSTAALLDLTT
jgi:hypothetical protein